MIDYVQYYLTEIERLLPDGISYDRDQLRLTLEQLYDQGRKQGHKLCGDMIKAVIDQDQETQGL